MIDAPGVIAAARSGNNRLPRSFWLLTAVIVVYVALCSGNRDSLWGIDAWEHHRVLKALAEDPWQTENPTLATRDPSARYSPYFLTWAVFSRATGIDAFKALSAAAAVNTLLLFLGMAALLKSFGEARSASATIPVMLGLYGGVPAHSNSWALSDLPWHEVNPSAFSFATALFVLALFVRFERMGWKSIGLPLIVVLLAVSLLDHVISGTFGLLGMGVLALTAPRRDRPRLLAAVLLIALGALALCSTWPWYSFWKAATIKLPAFFINPFVNYEAITRWCVPALVLSVLALTLRDNSVVRLLLVLGYACYGVGVIAMVLPASSPGVGAVSRLPLLGLIYFHMTLGIFAHHRGLFQPATWPKRLRALLGEQGPEVAMPALETLFAVTLAYFLLPQVWTVLTAPHLARRYVATLVGRESKQVPIKPVFDRLMQPIGPKDVVLSDESTMWVIPSSKGRIVSSLHGELFVPDQDIRHQDVAAFFAPETSDRERIDLIRQYGVEWIVLNPRHVTPQVIASLLEERAVVRREQDLVLMNAEKWIEARVVRRDHGSFRFRGVKEPTVEPGSDQKR
jgi:hypothetical protein